MVKFDKYKHFIEDVYADNGILIIDTNCQGIWETGSLKEMKICFPNIYKQYMKLCLSNSIKLGSCYIFEEGDYKVALLTTKRSYLDRDTLTIIENFSKAISDLFIKIPSDVWLYSPILGRKDACSMLLLQKLREKNTLNYTWTICTKKGSIC